MLRRLFCLLTNAFILRTYKQTPFGLHISRLAPKIMSRCGLASSEQCQTKAERSKTHARSKMSHVGPCPAYMCRVAFSKAL
jgi:hypothetical protein